MVDSYSDLEVSIQVVGSDITNSSLNFLPKWHLKDEESLTFAYFDAICRELRVLGFSIEDAQDRHWIDYSIGADLDKIGALINLPRLGGEGDESYRGRLKTYVQSFVGGGTAESLKKAFAARFGIEETDTLITDITPVPRFLLVINVDALVNPIPPNMTNTEVENLIKATKAAGVGYVWYFLKDLSDSDLETMQFDDSFNPATDIIDVTYDYLYWDIGNWDEHFWGLG